MLIAKEKWMNYDSSISDQVNLSKVLDEMILDGTEHETIVQFLKSHERSISEIYKGSAFAYALYDLGTRTYSPHEDFLFNHITDLSDVDCCYAASILATAALAFEGSNFKVVHELRAMIAPRMSVMRDFVRAGWRGSLADEKIVTGEIGLIEHLEALTKDERDMRSFLTTSHLARTVFMASTFLRLSPTCQYMALRIAKGGDTRDYRRGNPIGIVFGHMVCSLLKQLLALGEVEMFNWVEKVTELGYGPLGWQVRDNLLSTIPASIKDMGIEGNGSIMDWLGRSGKEKQPASFEEVVFEMNLVSSEFEPCDLFLFIYFFNKALMDGMKENAELLEFFSLPFNWSELSQFKDVHGRPIQKYVDIINAQ